MACASVSDGQLKRLLLAVNVMLLSYWPISSYFYSRIHRANSASAGGAFSTAGRGKFLHNENEKMVVLEAGEGGRRGRWGWGG